MRPRACKDETRCLRPAPHRTDWRMRRAQSAAARIQEARAQERLARAQLFPTLDFGAAVSRSHSTGAAGDAVESTALQPVFQSAYEIDIFNRIGSTIEVARQSTLATRAARNTAALTVAAATSSGYVTLRALDARREVVQATITSRVEALRLARARTQAIRRNLNFVRPRRNIRRPCNCSHKSIWRSAVRRMRSACWPAIRPVRLNAAGRWPDCSRRRYLLACLRTFFADVRISPLAATDACLAAARAQFFAQPSPHRIGWRDSVECTCRSDWHLVDWRQHIGALFQGGRLTANVEASAARRDQAAFSYRRTALTAFREVEDTLAAVDRLAVQRASQEAQRIAVAQALRHTTNRYASAIDLS